MGYLDLKFDPAAPYSPIVNAPAVTANFQLPFGFSLNISEVSQNITLAINTTGAQTESFAVIQTPFSPAVSNQQNGTIIFPLNSTAIAGIPGKESFYNQYTYALTASDNYTFMVSGIATTKTNTPIGPIVLTGINFTVPTTLKGLQFLNSTATVINSLDVTGGTEAGLALAINVTMDNPSDFGISTGDFFPYSPLIFYSAKTYNHDAVVSDNHEYYHNDHDGLRNDDLMEEYSEKAAPPPKQKFYKKKKYWIICSITTVIVVVVAVVLALYVIFPKIAQSLMNKSKIDVTAAGITFNKPDALANQVYAKRDGDDMNSTFYMNMESALSDTGPFHASIKFHNPVQIYYNESYLGDIFLYNETSIGGGHDHAGRGIIQMDPQG
ncbi:hypothetical protein MAM1_0031d02382 [Mucor ambiguus]|uniref:Uncharacterized protein n=1 Tax=Mucor ambiguus TaxID=91626 RepID=A0A0C9MIL6_9FUNG|nr:hypothetical protein MAM1_0031d02382 [Mucor ambiguus]